MWYSKKYIIFCERRSISLFLVSQDKRVTLVYTYQLELADAQSWSTVFTKIARVTKKTPVRILLSDEISYVLYLAYRKPSDSLRQEILVEAQSLLPDGIVDWDFVEVTKDGSQQLLFFAPVTAYWKQLIVAVRASSIQVVAIEPAVLAVQRHANPVLGIARKKDLDGDDAHVLNIRIPNTSEISQKKTVRSWSLGLPIRTMVLLMVFVVSIIVFIFLLLRRPTAVPKRQSALVPSLSPKPSLLLSPTMPIDEATAEANLVRSEDLRVLILNGSGIAGAAQEIADLLESFSFATVETGNADSYDYEGLQIQATSLISESEVFHEIVSAFEGYSPIVQEDLVDDEAYDLIITVGK